MKKRRLLLAVFVTIVSVWAVYRAVVPSYASVLEANWDIEIPVKAFCKVVYEQDAGPSFHGDGIRYHVFSYRNASFVEKMLLWSDDNGNTLAWSQINGGEKTYQSYTEAAEIWLGELEVPDEQRPDYEACFYCYQNKLDNSEIILFWNPGVSRLYIVENLI